MVEVSVYLFFLPSQLPLLKEVKAHLIAKGLIKVLTLISRFPHKGIITKTCSRMTTPIQYRFFLPNMTLVHTHALLSIDKISYSNSSAS